MGQSIEINGEAGKKRPVVSIVCPVLLDFFASYLCINMGIFVIRFPSPPSDCLAASFFGDSYVHQHMAEASSDTSLHMRFRTSAQSGLLFLAAGRRDFLLLNMVSGRLQVKKIKINEKELIKNIIIIRSYLNMSHLKRIYKKN